MGRLLFIIFMAVPLIEIGLFISLGQAIGLWPTLFGVVVTAVIGSAILRFQGGSLIAELRRTTQAGQMPAQQIAEGLMLGIAGALLLTPGYFTDFCGFLLLVPPIRLMIYNAIKARMTIVSTTTEWTSERPKRPDTIDLDREDWHDDDR